MSRTRFLPQCVSTDPDVNAALDQAETLMRQAAVEAISVLNAALVGRMEGTTPAYRRLAVLHGDVVTYDTHHAERAQYGLAAAAENVA